MPRLMARLRHDADRGAITALVAILFGGGVLLGTGALVVDVGRLYSERAQLQNAADAAALAVAQACAKGATGCGTSTAVTYANNNSNDNASSVDVVCGSDTRHLLLTCPAGGAPGCTTARPSSGNFVEVRTSTRQPNGKTLLPPSFAQAIVGAARSGLRVAACSRVGWGGPAAAYGFGMTLSMCEWQSATAGGTSFAPSSSVPASYERVLKLHTTSGTTCPLGPSGWILPGGFGWLAAANGKCETKVDANGDYLGDTGVSGSTACKDELTKARNDKRVLLVPVYDGAGGAGHEGRFHLKGFASFVVTGYYLPGLKVESWLTTKNLCKGDDKCVYGYFTAALLPADAVLGGPEMGATAVRVVG
ncbi:hypothetical protein Lesp02_23210 [Lentzea sp. NBRC 105346]|uniref:pilus assembly protein TadG-related protein n=1 Tax=Lentzea sp. NBRC 105346 TaxID=3032205 RepID=UPI0024A1D786|nr:pilus assembly protein TadG-related protein [Lentzea sp. NBRC 105346]GLZ30131.1 hypothetical protein Lesp02_23210 [Lentzea sp. NBRC 105346]